MEAASIFNSVSALIFVLALIGLTSVALRYFGSERFLRKNINKSTKKRLKLVDFLVVDAKTKMILVKRDDVEHLILVGGEKNTVVERDIKADTAKK